MLIPIAMNKFLAVTAVLSLLISCRNGSQNKTQSVGVPQEITERKDSTYLFDGVSLDGWEITNFGPQGPVTVSGGQIVLGMGEGCTGITYKEDFPEVNYKITLDAKRVAGNDFFCGMTFPVEKEPCTLIVGGWGGTTVGLSSINRKDASENQTTTYMNFEKDRWYRITLIVKKDTIRAFIDDKKVVDYARGKNDVLSIRPEVVLSKPFGIASWYTTAALKDIRLEKIEE